MKYDRGTFIVVPNKDLLRGQSPQVQTLFMWLCYYANTTGDCFPSRDTLAKDCGMSIASVKRSIAILVSLSVLVSEAQYQDNRRTTNLYSIILGGSHRPIGSGHTDPTGGVSQTHRTVSIGTQSIGTQKRLVPRKKQEALNAELRAHIRKTAVALAASPTSPRS